MDQKKVAGMKERGKKDEQREEREIWNRAIFYSSFMSCSGTLHSFPLCSPHIDADSTEIRCLGTSTGVKSDTECPAAILILPVLLFYTT